MCLLTGSTVTKVKGMTIIDTLKIRDFFNIGMKWVVCFVREYLTPFYHFYWSGWGGGGGETR